MSKLAKNKRKYDKKVLKSKQFSYAKNKIPRFQAHSCVEKAALIGFVKLRQLEHDENLSLRGDELEEAIQVSLHMVPRPPKFSLNYNNI